MRIVEIIWMIFANDLQKIIVKTERKKFHFEKITTAHSNLQEWKH